MATPVKAYTSPTSGPMRIMFEMPASVQALATPIPSPSKVHIITNTTISGVRIPLRGFQRVQYDPSTNSFPVPAPPMGTLKLATFPAIYFRKASSRPPTGQLWPRTR